MKKLLLLAAAIIITQSLSAGGRVRTGIAPFKSTKKNKEEAAAAVSEITSVFSKYKFIRLLDRSRIDTLMNEIVLKQQGIIDENTAVREGKLLGLQVMVVGRLHRGRLSAKAIHIESQKVIGAHSTDAAQPAKLALKLLRTIENHLAREKLKTLRNDSPSIKLEFWLEADGKKVNSKTRVGKSSVFKFRSNQPGYLTIVDIQPGGDVVILYPNEFTKRPKLQANRVYSVPSEDDEFEITVTEPAGKDTLVAFFTRKKVPWLDPRKLQGEGFLTVKDGKKLDMARGFAVTATKLKKKEWESKTLEIEVVR